MLVPGKVGLYSSSAVITKFSNALGWKSALKSEYTLLIISCAGLAKGELLLTSDKYPMAKFFLSCWAWDDPGIVKEIFSNSWVVPCLIWYA